MSRFVLDASVALSWCFPDENDPLAHKILQALPARGAIAPAIWPLEISNAVLVAERRKRLKRAETSRFLALVQALDILVDPRTHTQAFGETIMLARRYTVSTYDAAYLELAIREGLPLATLDGALAKVARKVGVEVLKP